MVRVREKVFLSIENGKYLERMELQVDRSSELPKKDAFDGSLIAQGSIAWDISTGEFYGMKSDGTWVRQGG